MNYKSGELVKITGNSNHHHFTFGETVRLKEKDGSSWLSESLKGGRRWWVRESDMTPVKPATMPQKIIITTDGKTTLARLFDGKTMVKRAEAKCAPSDVFDFGVGAELAVKRLMGANPDAAITATEPVKENDPVKLYCVESWMPGSWITKGKIYEIGNNGHIRFDDGYSLEFRDIGDHASVKLNLVPLVRRPAKVGEWVYINNAHDNDGSHIYGDVHNGAIFKANFSGVGSRAVRVNENTWLWKDEYLVLDGYTGDPA